PNANDIVMAENQFNDPPGAGNQFFITRISITYVGNETGAPSSELDYQAVGASSKGYTIYNDYCGVYPEDPYTVTELFPGGTAEFNLCWQIDSADQDSLVMYIESWLDFESDPVWFSLQP